MNKTTSNDQAIHAEVERQSGRAAMLVGITRCVIQDHLDVDALDPTGGFDGAVKPPIIAALAVASRCH